MSTALAHLKKADPTLGAIIDRVGPCKIRYTEPDFEALARSIVFQQLSGKSARAIFARVRGLGESTSRMTAAHILARTDAELRAAGLSQRKAHYLRHLAERTSTGEIDFDSLSDLADEEVITRLTAVKGIGMWTAQMFLLFALRRPDVLAAGDHGIRSAVRKAYGLRRLPKPAKIETLAKSWHPHCSVACWYLWRSLETVVPS